MVVVQVATHQSKHDVGYIEFTQEYKKHSMVNGL